MATGEQASAPVHADAAGIIGNRAMETGFATFDTDGNLVEINTTMAGRRHFADASPAKIVLPQILERFESINEQCAPFEPAFIADVIRFWGEPGTSIEVKLKKYGWRLLTNIIRSDGGITYLSTDISALRAREKAGPSTPHLVENTAIPDADKMRAHAMLHDAIQSLDEGIALWDKDFRLVTCNRAYADYTGVPMEHYVPGVFYDDMAHISATGGTFVAAIGHEEDFAAAIINMRHAYADGMEAEMTDGRWVVGACHRTELGSVLYILSDITERKQAQHKIMRTLDDTLQSVSEGFSLWDEQGRLVTCNQAYRDVLLDQADLLQPGVRFEDMTRTVMDTGLFKTPKGKSVRWVLDALKENHGFMKDLEIERADGAILLASFLPTELGRFVHTSRDITAERRAAEAERDADMLLRKIVDACPVNFMVSRVHDGKVIYCPPPSRERFGDIKSTRSFFLDPQHRVDYLDALLPTGELNDYPVRFRRSDGSILHGLTSARVTDYKGEDVIVSATRDISEQLAMQAELEKQKEIAHQNEKMSALGELLAGVAHELNNPLSIVVGYAQMMQEKVTDPTLRRRVDRIHGAAQRCAKIVKTFLAMARQRPARIEQCSLNEIVEIAWDVAGYGLRTNGVAIDMNLQENLPPIAVDADQMAQVFTNLLVNAEQALEGRDKDAHLTIITGADANGKTVFVRFKDNGKGMSADIKARIFEPFFTTKDVGTGTGVGLAFCHRIVTAHAGLLAVKSKPNRGATFTIRLPVAKDLGPTAPDLPHCPGAHAGTTILVVDDEVGITQLLNEMLSEEGFVVETVNNALHALERMKERQFDVVLSDMKMPGMDGQAFLKQLTLLYPEMTKRFAFLTGDTMSPQVSQFLSQCGLPYLEKPVATADLLTLISQLATPGDPYP